MLGALLGGRRRRRVAVMCRSLASLSGEGLWAGVGELAAAVDSCRSVRPVRLGLLAWRVRWRASVLRGRRLASDVTALRWSFASDPFFVACLVAAVGGSGCWSFSRGCRGGGGDLDGNFVLWLRRRADARSGVVVEPRSMYRSAASAMLRLQLQVCPRSSSRLVAGVGGEDLVPVLPQLGVAPSC